jgi:hypothetical protein
MAASTAPVGRGRVGSGSSIWRDEPLDVSKTWSVSESVKPTTTCVPPGGSLPADDFDQTPAFDPTAPEPNPELDLDRTRGA